MHDDVDLALVQEVLDQGRIADIAVDEAEILVCPRRFEIGDVPGIGQRIQDDHGIVWVFTQPVVHEVRADKSCPARHQ